MTGQTACQYGCSYDCIGACHKEMPAMATIKKGQQLMLSHGCYSDWRCDGPFRVLKTFDQNTVVAEFRAQWAPEYEGDAPRAEEMIAWLAKAGYVEDVPNVTGWHLGDYHLEPEHT